MHVILFILCSFELGFGSQIQIKDYVLKNTSYLIDFIN